MSTKMKHAAGCKNPNCGIKNLINKEEVRIAELESEGLTTSDAQAVLEAEQLRAARGAKHTPGPWIVEQDGDELTICFKDLNKDYTTQVATVHGSLTHAALISSAPEMLEALEVALETLLEQPDLVGDADISVRTIKTAISKAKGGAK